MKLVLLIFSLLYVLNLLDCSFRRLKAKNKRKNSLKNKESDHSVLKANNKSKASTSDEYSGSSLEACIESLAIRLCWDMGKYATYAFLGNLDNFISKSLKDTKLYENLFGNTFEEGINNGSIDPSKIQDQILTTAMAVLGGRSEDLVNYPPAYWLEYSKRMAEENKSYLKRLVKASRGQGGYEDRNQHPPKKGLFEKTKDAVIDTARELADVSDEVVQNGLKGAGKLGNGSGGLSPMGETIASKLGSFIIDMSIYIIQRHMLNQAESAIFSVEEGNTFYANKKEIIRKINKQCGKTTYTKEDLSEKCAYDGVATPAFLGNHEYIDGTVKLGPQHKRKLK